MRIGALSALALIAAFAASAQTKEDLIGTWELVSTVTIRPNGERIPRYGEHAVGFLTYTRDGRMSVILTNADRKPLSGDQFTAPAAERAEAFSGSSAYAGRYTIEGDRVVHHVEAATLPNRVNEDEARRMILRGNRLTLSAPTTVAGEQRIIEIVWERLK
jgi:hypothetical protein